jgi:single-strand DNA-binding protein
MSINKVVVSGNLTKDAEVRTTQSGIAIASVSIAVNDRIKDAQGNWTDKPNYFDAKMFGARAEKISPYLTKGTKVAIEGKLQWSSWEKDGQRRSKVEILIDNVEFMSRREQQPTAQPEVQQAEPSYYDTEIPF